MVCSIFQPQLRANCEVHRRRLCTASPPHLGCSGGVLWQQRLALAGILGCKVLHHDTAPRRESRSGKRCGCQWVALRPAPAQKALLLSSPALLNAHSNAPQSTHLDSMSLVSPSMRMGTLAGASGSGWMVAYRSLKSWGLSCCRGSLETQCCHGQSLRKESPAAANGYRTRLACRSTRLISNGSFFSTSAIQDLCGRQRETGLSQRCSCFATATPLPACLPARCCPLTGGPPSLPTDHAAAGGDPV